MTATTHDSVDHMDNLRSAIYKSAKQATFACGGKIPIKLPSDSNGSVTPTNQQQVAKQVLSTKPVTIRFGKSGTGLTLSLPAAEDDPLLQSLFHSCKPATFGRGGEDVYDETYRRATKLDTTEFCTDFSPYEHGIIDIITQLLLPSIRTVEKGIRAELYKLNAYSAPAHFKPHVDTPRSGDQFGSLVVCLPSGFEGGVLAVRHDGEEVCFDWSLQSGNQPCIQWAAFYSDCEHEVFPVVLGHRITLTYNLFVSRGVGNLAGGQLINIDRTSLPLYQTLHAAICSESFLPSGGNLAIGLHHTYPFQHRELHMTLPGAFKGVDFAIYETISKLKLRFNLIRDLAIDKHQLEYLTEYLDLVRKEKEDDPESKLECNYILGGRIRHNKKLKGAYLEGFGPTEEDDNTYEGYEFAQKLLEEDGAIMYYDGDITWLSLGRCRDLSHLYLAYGNEASLGLVYSYAAFLVQIPSFEQRVGVALPQGGGSDSKRQKTEMYRHAADTARFSG